MAAVDPRVTTLGIKEIRGEGTIRGDQEALTDQVALEVQEVRGDQEDQVVQAARVVQEVLDGQEALGTLGDRRRETTREVPFRQEMTSVGRSSFISDRWQRTAITRVDQLRREN